MDLSYLNKVIRKESSFAFQSSLPPSAAHPLDVFDDVAGPEVQFDKHFHDRNTRDESSLSLLRIFLR